MCLLFLVNQKKEISTTKKNPEQIPVMSQLFLKNHPAQPV